MDCQRSPEFLLELRACVAAAVALPCEQRADFLDGRCAGNVDLRAAVDLVLLSDTTLVAAAPQDQTAAWSAAASVGSGAMRNS